MRPVNPHPVEARRRRTPRRMAIGASLAGLLAHGCAEPIPAQADPQTEHATLVSADELSGKHLVGYQGWFSCPGDGSPLNEWVHWSRGATPTPDTVTFDAWPEVGHMPADALCRTGFRMPDGRPAPLFSSYRASTVDRHVQWMAEHGIDGALLQRFTNALHDPRHRAFKDQVAHNMRVSAERHGRVFAVVYDISGTDPADWVERIRRDWRGLVDDAGLTGSEAYLHDKGRPLVGVWGIGFEGRPGTPAEALELLDFFQRGPDPRYRATVMGGVPAHWRTLSRDAKPDPAWTEVYGRLDVLSPWTVGRYRDAAGADDHRARVQEPDLRWTRSRGIAYLPVAFPGFSWANLKDAPDTFDLIPRRAGRFYWRQVFNAVDMGSTALMTAMFDEVDEATAILPIAADRSRVPDTGRFLHLGQQGQDLPDDWYLRLAGAAAEVLGGRRPNTAQIPISARPPTPAPPEAPPEPDLEPDPDPDPDPSPTMARHVRLAYRGILGREPDPGGLNAYVGQLAAGASVEELCGWLLRSPEFAAGPGRLPPMTLAQTLYRGILGRDGDPGGLAATRDAIVGGRTAPRAAAMITSEESRRGGAHPLPPLPRDPSQGLVAPGNGNRPDEP